MMNRLKIKPFGSEDRTFLEEYCLVLSPIASALDNLQGSECPYGIVLPTLFKTESQLQRIQDEHSLKMCQPLLDDVKSEFHRRFGQYMELESKNAEPGLIATVCHPYFKLCWLAPEKKTRHLVEKIISIVVGAADIISYQMRESTHAIEQQQTQPTVSEMGQAQNQAEYSDRVERIQSTFQYDRFFDENPTGGCSLDLDEHTKNFSEITRYLAFPPENNIQNLDQLSRFPMVRNLYRKFNVTVPSEMPMERELYSRFITKKYSKDNLPTISEKAIDLLSTYFQHPEIRENVDMHMSKTFENTDEPMEDHYVYYLIHANS